jgi:hypothetical protein
MIFGLYLITIKSVLKNVAAGRKIYRSVLNIALFGTYDSKRFGIVRKIVKLSSGGPDMP